MAKCRLTLRVAPDTDIDRVISRAEAELANQGVANSALIKLLATTASRFQTDLLRSGASGASGQEPTRGMGDTVMQGNGYRIRITTKNETLIERVFARILGRPGSIS